MKFDKVIAISAMGLLGFSATACNSNSSNSSSPTSSGSAGGTGTITSCNARSNIVAAPSKLIAQNVGTYLESSSSGAALQKLSGHIPRAVKSMTDQGKVADDQQLSIEVALNLNNESELAQQLNDLYTPGNPQFHRFLKPADFRAKYSPTGQQIEQVKSYLIAQGIVPASVNANQTFVRASASVGAINSAFHTEIHQYKNSAGASYYSPAYELQIDASLPVKAILGLQNVMHAQKHLIQKTNVAAHSGGYGAEPQANVSGLSPANINKVYNVPSSVTGAGQTLALFELDGYTASDITAYENNFGLASVKLDNVLVDNATGSAGGGADEVTLDIELMIAMAPGASKIMVYEGENDDTGMLDVYDKIASDDSAKEISSSWGSTESTGSFADSENTVFEQMATQGQSIFAAAGDSGAEDNGSSLSVDDPSSQPYMVGAGGTTLTTNSSGAYVSEMTWTDGGGGISTVWSIPSWQKNVISSSSTFLGSTTMRNVPDVSLDADPNTGYAIYLSGSWTEFGGTSCAAPLWAAFTALVNQQREAEGLSDLGFPNPALYALGVTSDYSSDFHDIADGSTNGYYPAVSGYDDATGLGTINGQNLFNDLTKDSTTTGGSCS